MAKLDRIEKEEFLTASLSEELGRDMRVLRSRSKSQAIDIDRYLRFLSAINTFANHVGKPFRKIIDNEMKI
jgi:hypothetical protein